MSINRIISNPMMYAIMLLGRFLPDTIAADTLYLKLLYQNRMKKKLDLKNPQTYNEKLQWLKLYNRCPEYTTMVDKDKVKYYVSERLGEEYVIPTLGVWNHFDEIDFDKLPEQFVLKCTHDSGGLVICKDKSTLDKTAAKKKIEHALKRKYYLNTREWPYKDVKPRIIAEQYMVDESGYELKDYKFFVFDGVMRAMFIATGRNTETCFDFFDRNFKHLPIKKGHPNSSHKINKPENYDKMIELAEKLGQGIPHVRIDFYNVNGKIYFGEITFFSGSGMGTFEPAKWDKIFGSWINLDSIRKMNLKKK